MAKKDKIVLPYSLVRNTLLEAEGYHRVLTHAKSVDADTLFAAVAAKMPGQSATGAKLVWEALVATATEYLAERQCKVSVNGVMFALAIPGSTEAINGTPEAGAYVSISLPDAMRNVDADVTPVYSAEEEDVPDVKSVEDLSTHSGGEIRGTEQFRICGNNLTAAGDDEALVVIAADGTKAVAEVDGEDGYGMFITAHLPAALPPGKGKVVLDTHGKRTPEGELRHCVKVAMITAGDAPPPPAAPTITGALSEGYQDGEVYLSGSTVIINGTNLTGCDYVDFQDEDGESFWGVNVAENTGTQITTERVSCSETSPETGKLVVTTPGGTASYNVQFYVA